MWLESPMACQWTPSRASLKVDSWLTSSSPGLAPHSREQPASESMYGGVPSQNKKTRRETHGTAQVRTHSRPRSQRRLRHRGCSRRSEATTRHSRRLRRAGRFHPGARDRPNVPRLPTRPASSGDRASMYCNRTSAPRSSRGFGVSMWHYFYASSPNKKRMFPIGRSP